MDILNGQQPNGQRKLRSKIAVQTKAFALPNRTQWSKCLTQKTIVRANLHLKKHSKIWNQIQLNT